MDLHELRNVTDSLRRTETMPVLFVGHGSPMNGIVDNEFSVRWQALGKELPLPRAVLCVSAHWLTRGTCVTAMEFPRTIHDFGGFPPSLYEVQYPAPGDPRLAEETKRLVRQTDVVLDHDWGLDHGTWTVVRNMYPEASIPVLQLSIDYFQPAAYHYELGRSLSVLRDRGVLIIGSGNMVHNLRLVAFDKIDELGFGFEWALQMNEVFKKNIEERNHNALIHYDRLGTEAKLAVPTPDHYYPLLYALSLQKKKEDARLFNDKAVGGSVTMTSVVIG